MRILGARRRLTATLRVASNRAHVCDLHDDSVAERTRVRRAVRVGGSTDLEAATACVASTQTRRATKGELADCRRIAACGIDAAC